MPDVCVSPTPIANASDTMTIVRSSNSHSLSILIPSYIIEPNIITVQPPRTACGRELKNAPSGGKSDDKIKINAPIKIVNRLMTCVIVTSPTFWLKEVNGRHPKQPESALENPSTASDPCNSSILISRSKAPVHTALVAPVVSAADTRNTIAIVKNAPRSKIGLWLVRKTSFGRLKTPTSCTVFVIPEKSTIGAIPATVKMIANRYPRSNPTRTFRFLYTPFSKYLATRHTIRVNAPTTR